MKTALKMIEEERKRQIEKEGWTSEHDDKHTDQSLALAAALYASPTDELMIVRESGPMIDPWPWWGINDLSDRGKPIPVHAWDKRKQHSRLRRLQIAGALIVAEIERLQRLEKKK